MYLVGRAPSIYLLNFGKFLGWGAKSVWRLQADPITHFLSSEVHYGKAGLAQQGALVALSGPVQRPLSQVSLCFCNPHSEPL